MEKYLHLILKKNENKNIRALIEAVGLDYVL